MISATPPDTKMLTQRPQPGIAGEAGAVSVTKEEMTRCVALPDTNSPPVALLQPVVCRTHWTVVSAHL